MSTTLESSMQELSKQLGDYWASTTTSDGSAAKTTLVDTALMAKANDWVETNDEVYDRITSGTYDNEERKVASLDSSNGTLTILAHGGKIVSGITYEVHRLFSASDKREALIWAARRGFPHIFQEVWDESLVSGNWLKDGSFERWTGATTIVDWTATTVTATQITTSPYYKNSLISCKLDTAAGTLSQSISNFDDLKALAGKTVTFSCQGWCDTASCLRLSINDGTTQTYSDYHDGGSAWTQDNPRNDGFYVQQTIADNPTEITFTIHHESASGTSYIDDGRAISGTRGRLYIGYLWLARNRPSAIYIEPSNYSQETDWERVRGYDIDENGYLYIPTVYPNNRRLRIRGMGYLDFLAAGASSTAWSTATIALDLPQLDILVAKAALHLYGKSSIPNFDTGTAKEYKDAYGYWQLQLQEAIEKFAMRAPPITVHTGVH